MKLAWTETDSPIGRLTLAATPHGLCRIDFAPHAACADKLGAWARAWWKREETEWREDRHNPVLRETASQLAAYFAGDLERFDVPVEMLGTPFQKQVWDALRDIPYGELCSYRDVAAAVGKPLAARAVGGANNRNPVPVIVPCHRVIGADGSLVGYGGGMPIKTHLLALERTRSAKPAIAAGEGRVVL